MSTLSADSIIPKHALRTTITNAFITEGTLSGGSLFSGTLSDYAINTSTIASPQITGGTLSGCTITSPIVSGGTFSGFSAEMAITTGSYTCTGLASNSTGTPATIVGSYRIALLDPFVIFTLQGPNDFGNASVATFALTIPAGLRPAADHYAATFAYTDSVGAHGLLHVTTGGVVTIGMTANDAGFTAGKEVQIGTVCTSWPIA